MDIIVDTNILRQDNLRRSQKFRVVFDYLQKTSSHLIIPIVVRDEMIAIYRRQLAKLLDEAKSVAARMDELRCDNGPSAVFHLDIEEEVSAYESFFQKLTHGGGALELPHRNDFLGEVIRRQINRIRPSSDKGEESRDVVIWLSIKEFLRQSKREAVFISQNTKQFGTKNSKELHPDLKAELLAENLRLRFFCTLDEFIQQQSSRVDFVTEDWIKRSISSSDIERLSSDAIESSERMWRRYSDRKDIDWTGSISVVGFSDLGLGDFYVYDFTGDDFYLHASYTCSVEVELESRELESAGLYMGSYQNVERHTRLRTVSVDVFLEIECRIRDQKIEGLRLENWDFG